MGLSINKKELQRLLNQIPKDTPLACSKLLSVDISLNDYPNPFEAFFQDNETEFPIKKEKSNGEQSK